jgi:hypothetical protein
MEFNLPILADDGISGQDMGIEIRRTLTRVTGHTISAFPITGFVPAYGFCSVKRGERTVGEMHAKAKVPTEQCPH